MFQNLLEGFPKGEEPDPPIPDRIVERDFRCDGEMRDVKDEIER